MANDSTIITNELGQLYRAYSTGMENPLIPLARQYRNFAAKQKEALESAIFDKHRAYWKNKFKRQNLPVEFIQVPQVKIAATANSQFRDVLRLNVESGFQIEVPDGFSQTTLTQVLEVLRGI